MRQCNPSPRRMHVLSRPGLLRALHAARVFPRTALPLLARARAARRMAEADAQARGEPLASIAARFRALGTADPPQVGESDIPGQSGQQPQRGCMRA